MIILFSSLGKEDVQVILLRKKIRLLGRQSVIINTHILYESYFQFGIENNKKYLLIKNRKIIIDSVVFMTHPRIDAIIDIPKSVQYPNEWRLRNNWWLKEFCDFFSEKSYFPGSLVEIDKGESKMFLLFEALKKGILIPTINEISFDKSLKKGVSKIFQKPVGFPFCVTNKKGLSIEKALTSFGVISRRSSGVFPKMEQSFIEADLHIRCFMTQNVIFAVSRIVDKNQKIKEFRELNELPEFHPKWVDYPISNSIFHKLKKFMKVMNLSWACPEFLVSNNEHYFIDLNPCGDWYGFFNKNTREKIADEIVRIIIP